MTAEQRARTERTAWAVKHSISVIKTQAALMGADPAWLADKTFEGVADRDDDVAYAIRTACSAIIMAEHEGFSHE